MKISLVLSIFLVLALAAALPAQNASPVPPAGQIPPGMPPGPASTPAPGWRAGVSGRIAETGMGGRGVVGTVTAMAPGVYTVKTELGQTFKVQFSVNTNFMKQVARPHDENGNRRTGAQRGESGYRQQAPPEPIKATDIKVGDDIAALGEVSQSANSVGATLIVLIDPERAKMMHEQRANFGKTWLMGKVTAINETKLSIAGSLDNADYTIQADENTTFRKHREPITLADVQVGDMVRAEGSMKDGSFVAASVAVMGMPPGGMPRVPRDAQPAQSGAQNPAAPQTDAPQPK